MVARWGNNRRSPLRGASETDAKGDQSIPQGAPSQGKTRGNPGVGTKCSTFSRPRLLRKSLSTRCESPPALAVQHFCCGKLATRVKDRWNLFHRMDTHSEEGRQSAGRGLHNKFQVRCEACALRIFSLGRYREWMIQMRTLTDTATP